MWHAYLHVETTFVATKINIGNLAEQDCRVSRLERIPRFQSGRHGTRKNCYRHHHTTCFLTSSAADTPAAEGLAPLTSTPFRTVASGSNPPAAMIVSRPLKNLEAFFTFVAAAVACKPDGMDAVRFGRAPNLRTTHTLISVFDKKKIV